MDDHGSQNFVEGDLMDMPMEELLRIAFETTMLESMADAREQGTAVDDNGAPITRESLLWRDESGRYGVAQFNAAWSGFVLGFALAVRTDPRLTNVSQTR